MTSKGLLKDKGQLMCHVIAQSVFQPWKDVNKTACEQCHLTLLLHQESYPVFTVCQLAIKTLEISLFIVICLYKLVKTTLYATELCTNILVFISV